MNHITSDDQLVNAINYMANSTTPFSQFLSFVELKGVDVYWGVLINGKYYCAVHLMNEPVPELISDDRVAKEMQQIEDGMHTTLYLQGTDNTSYFKRLKTRCEIEEYLKNGVDCNDKTLLYYNS